MAFVAEPAGSMTSTQSFNHEIMRPLPKTLVQATQQKYVCKILRTAITTDIPVKEAIVQRKAKPIKISKKPAEKTLRRSLEDLRRQNNRS